MTADATDDVASAGEPGLAPELTPLDVRMLSRQSILPPYITGIVQEALAAVTHEAAIHEPAALGDVYLEVQAAIAALVTVPSLAGVVLAPFKDAEQRAFDEQKALMEIYGLALGALSPAVNDAGEEWRELFAGALLAVVHQRILALQRRRFLMMLSPDQKQVATAHASHVVHSAAVREQLDEYTKLASVFRFGQSGAKAGAGSSSSSATSSSTSSTRTGKAGQRGKNKNKGNKGKSGVSGSPKKGGARQSKQ